VAGMLREAQPYIHYSRNATNGRRLQQPIEMSVHPPDVHSFDSLEFEGRASDCTKLHHTSQKTATQSAADGDGRRAIWRKIHSRSRPVATSAA